MHNKISDIVGLLAILLVLLGECEMKKFTKRLLALAILIVVMYNSNITAFAASYQTPSSTYDIYDLVRNASRSGGCSDMIPQGITFAGDYLLISAYCKDETHNSVIYVFKESDKSYYGTIKLPKINHVGGIAYDCNREGNIWVANGNSVGCFKYSKLDDCKNKVLSINTYNREVSLSYQASTLCYDAVNNYLWIAQFSETDSDQSFARCYAVNNKTTTTPTLPYQFQISVPLKTQGISVRGDRMMISSSYGRTKDSTLYSYTWNQSTKTKTLKTTTTLPPLSEGVVMGSTYAYIVYESVATKYYDTCSYAVDYFASYKISDFGI